MTPTALLATALAGLTGLCGLAALPVPLPGDDDEKHAAAPADEGPHARAPLNVQLVIHVPARIVSPGEDFVDALAESESGRFTEGEHGYWVDGLGIYEWDDDEEIYWETIDARTLTRGRQDFVQFCSSCHGLQGDGYGRSAQGLRPPPRSFLQSTFKFTKVDQQYLPNDDALVQLVTKGLDGTPMYPWAVSEQRLRDIIQYIKSLSPEDEGWRDPTNEIGEVVQLDADSWGGTEDDAIARGEFLYHKAQCYSCHPAYVSPARLNEIRELDPSTTYAEDLSYAKLKRDSSYKVLGYAVAITAPDFTWHTVRASRDVEETALTIAAGIGGAAMPTWKGAYPDKDIWAVAYYVRDIVDTYKDKPGRAAFMAGLRSGN
jgi:mono/diheme cytochrome c family protein